MDPSRTTKIEEIAARFCAAPLTAEAVFLRPAYKHGQVEREVCDLLVAFRRQGIVLSLKSQNDPTSRVSPKVRRWCAKSAHTAARQVFGAHRTIAAHPFWCEHWRRGRVDFAAGAVTPIHALVVIETAVSETVRLPDDLPQYAGAAPIAYIALNDTLNLVDQLRSFPDIVAYLDARAKLPVAFRRTIGNERLLVHYYMMHDESFKGCVRPEEFLTHLLVTEAEFRRRILRKVEADRSARAVELVSDALATRNPDYAVGLDAQTLARFDASEQRASYLRLQEHLCDLRLGERRALGEVLHRLWSRMEGKPTGGIHQSWWTDGKPDFLYLIASVRGIARPELLGQGEAMLRAALAHHGKARGMAIIDADGATFEVVLIELQKPEPDPEIVEAGRQVFGGRGTTSTPMSSVLPAL